MAIIDQLEAAAADGLSAVLSHVIERGGTPLRDANTATFVYLGKALGVRFRHWMNIFPRVRPFTRIDGTDVWWTSVDLPDGARVEYKIEVERASRKRLILDPLNPLDAGGPFGLNSVATGPGYQPSPLATPRPGRQPGRVVSMPVVSDVYEETRNCHLYLPAASDGSPVPLLVAHDGTEYLTYAALGTIVDNLGTPAAVLLQDPDDRLTEYGADARHAEHLVREAIPAARRRVSVSSVIALGASFGGVAALHAAWRFPGTFSALVLQSGSFVEATGGRFRRGRPFRPVVEFMHEFWREPGDLPPRMHLSCGQFDGLIGDNRRTVARLRALGVDVAWAESPDGHHWGLWRDLLGAGLAFALPSPGEH